MIYMLFVKWGYYHYNHPYLIYLLKFINPIFIVMLVKNTFWWKIRPNLCSSISQTKYDRGKLIFFAERGSQSDLINGGHHCRTSLLYPSMGVASSGKTLSKWLKTINRARQHKSRSLHFILTGLIVLWKKNKFDVPFKATFSVRCKIFLKFSQ